MIAHLSGVLSSRLLMTGTNSEWNDGQIVCKHQCCLVGAYNPLFFSFSYLLMQAGQQISKSAFDKSVQQSCGIITANIGRCVYPVEVHSWWSWIWLHECIQRKLEIYLLNSFGDEMGNVRKVWRDRFCVRSGKL